MSVAAAKAVEDGKADYDEYQAGWRRYVQCVAKAGYQITVLNQDNEVYSGQIPDGAVSSGAEPRCYKREFRQIDQLWQISRQDSSPTAEKFRACVTAHGETPAATMELMLKQLKKLKVDPQSCLQP